MHFSPWLIRKTGAVRRLRLYCFCYAGGNAVSFMPWQANLDPDIEVCAIQLPGRGARLGEQLYRSMPKLIEDLAQVILRDAPLPFAFFGHSLGGLLAFEMARFFARHQLAMPEHLFVSGVAAPQFRNPSKNLHALPDDQLIQSLRDYNGTPLDILENRDLMELVLPTIRADFALAENYQYRAGLRLNVPITVLAGKLDVDIAPDQVNGWQKETAKNRNVDMV